MAGTIRLQPAKRSSRRPPLRPIGQAPSLTGRSQSPAESIASSGTSRPRSPSVLSQAGSKRKEREFEHDAGEETNIHVVVRARGRSERELRENSGVVVSTNGVRGRSVELSMGPSALSNKTYHFDKVFSPAADQAIIFEDVVSPILNEMLTGFNCTIFAYGQTGTGKTYTMSGDMSDTLGLLSDSAGIIPRVLYSLFQKLETDEVECSVKCSFIELYNEELRDLLSTDNNAKLKIYDDANKKGHSATLVQGMEESHIKTASAGIKLLQQGSHRRQVAATRCNDLSSRSHTVFTITTYIKKARDAGEDYICAGKLNLVDLAGSENIQRSGAENKRAAEAGLINKSLLTLGRVINALVDKSSHIPYRESKLTRLLQDSLGGRTKTCIIATVSPAKSNLEETISTLDYAFRAKNIRNKPQINAMISKKTLLKEFTAEIEKLKSELIATRQRNGVYLTNEQYDDITVESESRRILGEEQRARIETLEISLRNKVQELFSLTSNFNIMKRDNEATRASLAHTKDVLEKTEIVLRDTRQNLAEEMALRKAHQSTEEQLHGLGSGLISTLGDTVNDIGGLHSKLRRRSDLHVLNREAWQQSSAEMVDVSQLVCSKVDDFSLQQSQLLASLSRRVDQSVSAEVEKLVGNQTFLQSWLAEYETSESEFRVQKHKDRDDMNTVLEEIKVLREEVKAKVGEGLNGLSVAAARISGEVISELDQFHTQLYTSYSTLGREFKTMFEEVAKHQVMQRKETEDLRVQLKEANLKLAEANALAKTQLQTCLEDERKASQGDRNDLLAQITDMLTNSASKQEQRLATSLEATQCHLSQSQRVFEEANQAYDVRADLWLVKDQAFAMQIAKSKDSLKGKMKQDWTDVNTRNSSIQKSTKAVHQETVGIVDAQLREMTVQMAALDEFVVKARSQNERNHGSHIESLNSMSASIQYVFSSVADGLQAVSLRMNGFKEDARSETTSLQATLSSLVHDITRSLIEMQANIKANPLREYVSTGETPQKRDWIYPKSLPCTGKGDSPEASVKDLAQPNLERSSSTARTPRKTPRTLATPRKGFSSPSKLPSPSKSLIYTDVETFQATSCAPQPFGLQAEGFKGRLKEIDINIARPASSDDADPSFSTSVSAVSHPPLKRHATAVEGSRLPMKLSGARGKVTALEGRENVNMLNQSIGARGVRRLRSSRE